MPRLASGLSASSESLTVEHLFVYLCTMIGGSTSLDELVARCEPDALTGLDDQTLAGLAESVLRLWPRLDAARLRLIAAVEARQAFRADGARDAVSWLAWKAGERRGAARREVELAATVNAMPAVDDALADGSLSKAKAVELGRARTADPADQKELVEAAKNSTVEEVARQIDRWQLEHQPAAEVTEALRVTPTPGGGRLEATLTTEHLEWVQVAVDAAADQLGLPDLAWEARRARGLVAVCRYFLDHADLPTRRQGRPTVVATMNADTLAARSGGSARLDSGAYITGESARRLACDASVIRLITDPSSMPLDVGRATRTISTAQARAVIHRDRHCGYQGCTAPPWACDIHHLDHWARGGQTDLRRLRLLCWHHHHLIHRHEASHHLVEDRDRRLRLEARAERRRPEHSHAA